MVAPLNFVHEQFFSPYFAHVFMEASMVIPQSFSLYSFYFDKVY